MNLSGSIRVHHFISDFRNIFISLALFSPSIFIDQISHIFKFCSLFPSTHRNIKPFPFYQVISLIFPHLFINNPLNYKLIIIIPLKILIINLLLDFFERFWSSFVSSSRLKSFFLTFLLLMLIFLWSFLFFWIIRLVLHLL